MTLLSPPFALGAAGQPLSGKLLRLSLGATFLPGAGVTAVSGVLAGPANTMGEVTLPSNAVTRVQAFRAVIQSTQDATAGQYVVPNDAQIDLANPAQDATQYRRALIVVGVADSQVAGVASTAATDRGFLEVQGGALASTALGAALPAAPPNSLLLGELLIPPAGQAVTLTPYNPRTTVRGGILPIIDDASTRPGHRDAAPAHTGAYRDHPSYGLQRGAGATWGRPSPMQATVTLSTRAAALAAGFSDAYAAGTISAVVYRLLGGGWVFLNVAFTQTRATYTPTAEGGHGDVDLFSVPPWMVPAYAVPGFDNTIRGAFYLLFTSGVFTHTASATSASWTAGDAHSVRGVYMLETDPA